MIYRSAQVKSEQATTEPALIKNVIIDFNSNQMPFDMDHQIFETCSCTPKVYPTILNPVFFTRHEW